MDTTKIKQIIELFEESKLAKMELEIEDIKIAMEKPKAEVAYVAAPTSVAQAPVVSSNEQEKPQKGTAIKSPLVGTYYAASGEGAKPFVEVGSQVKKGDVLCIIEAMKAMNEICSDCDGVVTSISGENGNLVQFDEVLMCIE